MTIVKILYMQVNNAGIIGAITDGDALAASGAGKVSFVNIIGLITFHSLILLFVKSLVRFLLPKLHCLIDTGGRWECQN